MSLCHVLFTAGTIGTNLATTAPAFAETPALQAVGTMAAWSLGSVVIGDLYRPEERACGVRTVSNRLRIAVGSSDLAAYLPRFYILGVMGGAISPAITGLFVQYKLVSWRGMLYLLEGLSATTLLLAIAFCAQHAGYPHAVRTSQEAHRQEVDLPPRSDHSWVCIRTLKDWRLGRHCELNGLASWADEFRLYTPALRSTAR